MRSGLTCHCTPGMTVCRWANRRSRLSRTARRPVPQKHGTRAASRCSAAWNDGAASPSELAPPKTTYDVRGVPPVCSRPAPADCTAGEEIGRGTASPGHRCPGAACPCPRRCAGTLRPAGRSGSQVRSTRPRRCARSSPSRRTRRGATSRRPAPRPPSAPGARRRRQRPEAAPTAGARRNQPGRPEARCHGAGASPDPTAWPASGASSADFAVNAYRSNFASGGQAGGAAGHPSVGPAQHVGEEGEAGAGWAGGLARRAVTSRTRPRFGHRGSRAARAACRGRIELGTADGHLLP